MALLDQQSKEELKKFFEQVEKKIEVILITDENNKVPQFDPNEIAKQLLEEVKEVSNGKFDFMVRENDSAFVKALGIDIEETGGKFGPTIVFKDNPRMVFLGLPSGHEFSVFLEDIHMLDKGHAHLPEDVVEKIKNINKKLEVLVFVTPTCPYCPGMTYLAHSMAYLNENIRGIMVEAMEFPEFANAFSVMGVPRTIIRDAETKEVIVDQEGMVPPQMIVEKLQ
jgi:glutaredoxin-like protein